MISFIPNIQRLDSPYPNPLEYSESDGQPMAESDYQLIWLVYLLDALRTYFAEQEDVYVGANLMMYLEKDNLNAVVAPDIFFVRGVGKQLRDTYKVWEEGKVPDLVIEILSKSSVYNDKALKRGLYAELGVQEYILFDPKFYYLKPALLGYQLAGDTYQPIPINKLKNSTLVLASQVLGLEFRLQGKVLRLVEPATGTILLPHEEEAQARRVAEAKAQYEAEARRMAEVEVQQEAEARRMAEARVAELEALVRQLREGK